MVTWLKEVVIHRRLAKQAIKKEILQMMGITKLHGCYRLYTGKTYARLFWLFVTVSTGVLFAIVLAELTKQYKADNVSAQVEIIYDYADGPSVTICSHNLIRRNYVEELKRMTAFSDELLMYLFHTFLRAEGFIKMNVFDTLATGERLLQDYMLIYKNFTVDSFIKEASFKCEEALVQCAFEGVIFDCCNERYSSAVLTDLGYCILFDWNKLSRDFSLSYHFGSVHGFQVMLDYQSHNEIHFVNDTASRIRQPFLNNFEPGFRFYVHDTDTVSYVNSEALIVSPNNKLSVGLKPIKYQFLEQSKGGTCRNTWPSDLRRDSAYSASTGPKFLQNHYLKGKLNRAKLSSQNAHKAIEVLARSTIHCYWVLKQLYLEGRLCSPKEVFDCISDFTEIASMVHNITYSPLCRDCAPECELFIYFTQNSIIHNILSSLGEYMKSLKQEYKLSYVRNNLATVHVFFAAKKYKIYSQSALSDLSDYLSKIGSNMGLFYGASVISLFELVLVLFKTIWAFASPSRAAYLREKARREMERKLRIEEIIDEHSISEKMVGDIPQTPERQQRELDQMMSLTLTPEQANAILGVETFIDSIYIPLRRNKVKD
uniref:Amiloride-sensitive sodium channel n=1 Tax=Setaria digitata TaxID=48799 RepID=A0A915PG09_9BILA